MKEMNQGFCQCCGMPMGDTDELYGTNADGSKNEEYCKYCFEKGAFTFQGTMEEMIEICVPNMAAANPDMDETEARKRMLEWFPTLKRWKKAKRHVPGQPLAVPAWLPAFVPPKAGKPSLPPLMLHKPFPAGCLVVARCPIVNRVRLLSTAPLPLLIFYISSTFPRTINSYGSIVYISFSISISRCL